MKKLKKYNEFVNEELKMSTYQSAAKKLKDKGHTRRPKLLSDYSDTLIEKIEPIEVELDNKMYTLGAENIIVNNDTFPNINITIVGDKNLSDALLQDNMGPIWDNNEIRTEFYEESKDFDNEGSVDWDELDQKVKNHFYEFCEMKQFIINLDFTFDDWDKVEHDISGIVVDDRKTANKLLKLLKDYGSIYGGDLEKSINSLKVNDLYKD